MYLTLAQLVVSPGALEIAQVASRPHAAELIDAELMERTLLGTPRTGFDPAAIAEADDAAGRVQDLIDESEAVVNGYLARRYQLPLATAPAILTTWTRSILRYKLQPDREGDDKTDAVVRGYRDAIKFLEAVAADKFSLGIQDPQTSPAAESDVRFDTGNKVFGREALP